MEKWRQDRARRWYASIPVDSPATDEYFVEVKAGFASFLYVSLMMQLLG
jgi:hypothetical protein